MIEHEKPGVLSQTPMGVGVLGNHGLKNVPFVIGDPE